MSTKKTARQEIILTELRARPTARLGELAGIFGVSKETIRRDIAEMSERGLLDETVVVWTGEFGRTPRVGQRNSDAGAGRDGRDHWPGCFTSVLAGGGIRGGQTYGTSDRYAAYPASNPVAPVDLVATAYHLLGVPEHQTLPDQQGRPLVICPGTPIRELMV